ncbi:uncharacterized protein MONBRDRAFT_34471 [Monosiga brevicollis MX1]|uniref:VPS10 domain-containing protein n=1 Tax=Monosiga brevicollis TaxID=81824 RepID=A9VBY9_MONBE|nr:uncharacterized protein MONBRDRAFT_34471 [Monosiga brevicollis MX1]EDQ84887.1 predicted protein [Monosiga brevicollis MX1]|eukprot:XP_001750228.1 hypothetical protein [Monosiga brevicollis MX1]
MARVGASRASRTGLAVGLALLGVLCMAMTVTSTAASQRREFLAQRRQILARPKTSTRRQYLSLGPDGNVSRAPQREAHWHQLQEHLKAHHQRPITDAPSGVKRSTPLRPEDLLPLPSTSGPTAESFPIPAELRRRRAASDNAACTNVDMTSVSERVSQATDSYTFEATGGLYLNWLGAPYEGIMAWLEFGSSTTQGNAYCSSDMGKTFAACSGITLDIADFVSIEPPNNKKMAGGLLVYALPVTGKFIFVASDDLQFTKKSVNEAYDRILLHPTDQTQLLGFVKASLNGVESDTMYHLKYSNGEFSETQLETHVHFAEWLQPQFILESDESDVILMTQYQPEADTSSGQESDADVPIHFVRIENPSSSTPHRVTLKENCHEFTQSDSFLFVKETPGTFGEQTLHVSSDNGKTFTETVFPTSGKSLNYYVTETGEGEALVVSEAQITGFYGNLSITIQGTSTVLQAARLKESPLVETALTGKVVKPASNPTGCADSGGIGTSVAGFIVLVQRGDCTFAEKVRLAEDAGAAALIIYDTASDYIGGVYGLDKADATPTIPAMLVGKNAGQVLWNKAGTDGQSTLSVTLVEEDVSEQSLYRETVLYISDATGVYYTVALPDILYFPATEESDEVVDLHAVQSQRGTLIANVLDQGSYVSLISYNKGALWSKIPVPENSRSRCEGSNECNLHVTLEIWQALYGVPLPSSRANAPGIVMVNGFVGAALADTYDSNVYLSRNGGFTWDEMFGKPHLYEILNYGALLVAIPYLQSSTISYSMLDGREDEWATLKIAESDVWLYFATEPSHRESAVSLFYQNDDYYWVTKTVDMADASVPYFFDYILTPSFDCFLGLDADFYTETVPNTGTTKDVCLLGGLYSHLRRSSCALCSIDVDQDVHTLTLEHSCACSREDYQCLAYGGISFGLSTSPALIRRSTSQPEESTTMVSSYAKIAGDVCEESSLSKQYEAASVELTCTSHKKRHLSAGAGFAVALAVLICLVVLIAGTFYCSPRARSLYQQLEAGLNGDTSLGPLDSDDDMLIGEEDALEGPIRPIGGNAHFDDDDDEDDFFK